MESRPLSWFLAQRRQSIQQEGLDRKLEAWKEERQKKDKENSIVRNRLASSRKERMLDLRMRDALASIRQLGKAAQRSKRLLSELADSAEFVRIADDLAQRIRSLESLVSKTTVKEIEDASENPSEKPQNQPEASYPRVV